MTPPPTPEPWDDGRLGAAFATRASRTRMPVDLESATRASLRGEQTSAPTLTWRRLLAPATVLVLAIATVAGGAALLGGQRGTFGFVAFRDGPTPDLRTLDAGTFTFDFPADWLAYDASAAFSGGSSTAVIGTQPVEARCGDERQVDINCVYEQPLDTGDIRVFVGSGAYRGGTILDRPDIENGTTTRVTIGGMPAIRNDYDVQPDSFYREDVSMAWEIALPTSLSNVIRIEVRAREWSFRGRINTAVEVRAAVQTMVDSFRFTPPPVPLPADPSAAVAAARAAIQTQGDGFRLGYVDTDSSALTYLDCPGDEPATATRASVRYGPGGDLGRPVDLACSWTITPETPSIWRLDLTYEWTVDGRSGRYVETLWLDAAGTVVASTFAGDPPPTAASEPSGPTEVSGLKVIPVVDAIEIRDAGIDDQELAVGGWYASNPMIGCPAPAQWPTSPVQPVCPDQWTVLMQEPEVLVTVEKNGATGRGPGGPAIEVDLDDVDRTWEPTLPDLGPATPVRIVVVGHFDDRRSAACPQELEQACRDRFVVDRVDWVGGETQPPSVVDSFDGDEASRVGDILKHLGAETPGAPVLSVVVVDGPTGIGRIEPFLGTGRGGLIDQRAIWVIRVLEGDRAATYLVIDGTDAIFEMTADGEPVAVGGTRPTPSAVASWPPDGATVIELTSEVGEARRPARVAVVDPTGWLASVREVRPDDPGLLDTVGAPKAALFDDPGHGGRFRLVWAGGVCDGDMTVTLERSARRIVVDGGLKPPCDAMGVGRQLVLEFTEAVDPGSIDVFYTETRSNQP